MLPGPRLLSYGMEQLLWACRRHMTRFLYSRDTTVHLHTAKLYLRTAKLGAKHNSTADPRTTLHVFSVWIIPMKMVSEDSSHISALSFLKSEYYGQIHIISGLSGQVITIGQCPRPGGSSLAITMTCDTLNCSRNVS